MNSPVCAIWRDLRRVVARDDEVRRAVARHAAAKDAILSASECAIDEGDGWSSGERLVGNGGVGLVVVVVVSLDRSAELRKLLRVHGPVNFLAGLVPDWLGTG